MLDEILDHLVGEKMDYKEYEKMAEKVEGEEYKGMFKKMAEDEYNHYKDIKNIFENMLKNT